jgi:hypothetical protein
MGIDHVINKHEGGDILQVEQLVDLNVFDLVKELEDLRVIGVTQRTEKCGDEEFATTTATVEVNVEEVVLVELDFEPSAAVRNDTEGKQLLAGGVAILLKAEARGTMELGNDDALGTVDDEGAALGHHRDFAHVDFLVFNELFLAEAEFDVEGNGVSDAVLDALDLGIAGLAEGVGNVFEDEAPVVGFDRKNLAENGLETLGFALFVRHALLEETEIRSDLDFDQVGRLYDFTKLTEVKTLELIAVGHDDFPLN